MSKQQPRPRKFRWLVRRVVKIAGLVLAIALVLGAVSVGAVWSHFWGAKVGNPTSDSCVNCHPMQSYVESQQATNLLASAHANEDVQCLDCHEYGLDQQFRDTVNYLKNDYQEPLPHERYSMDLCLSCHEHGSYDQIAWRTTDLGVTDSKAKGHEANPHQPPHYDQLECNSCHQIHQPSTLLCWECHNYVFDTPYLTRPQATPEATSP